MKPKFLAIALLGAFLLGAGGYAIYQLGVQHGLEPSSGAAKQTPGVLKAGDIDPATGKKVLYWHDPMAPAQKFDKPGKSPFMDMMLVPVYADGDGDAGQVTISSRVQQNLGVRTAEVQRTVLAPQIEASGSIAFNERDQAVLQARANGYIEHLYVRATLDRVSKGQALAELYVPEWVAAQEEFLSLRRMQGKDLESLLDGARQRMRQVGMSDTQIRLVESSGKLHPRLAITAPIGGVLVELAAREGMTAMPGATLFRINGLTTVWANAEIPESQAALLRPGAIVEARSPALPGTILKGKVQALLPEVNGTTRTIKARIELANSNGQLAPGMFVSVSLGARAESALTVPTEAIISTGKRTVVMLADADGRFRPVEVEIGIESGGQTEIKRGLEVGQKVVVSGQFLLDSEASLRATGTRMEGAPPSPASASAEHRGEARIEVIGKDALTLSHSPIPSLQWGAMTMDFAKPVTGLPPGLKAGQSVHFSFTMTRDGTPVLTRIEPMGVTERKP